MFSPFLYSFHFFVFSDILYQFRDMIGLIVFISGKMIK
ncbi:hypothetical protein BBR47_15230 [Brevibacillus brevis NBRC 100599]|uniref:Uncharacterized protein n=1 Tax=Brevibacillus brevis (strain 47 / JCM 6285 / NBRC 100599) TaxID=358681 RepID=C0Z930_BREBN|nr:hypothetical protein BBR47_15230 [Brevibacillus brevis NBRC 100599]